MPAMIARAPVTVKRFNTLTVMWPDVNDVTVRLRSTLLLAVMAELAQNEEVGGIIFDRALETAPKSLATDPPSKGGSRVIRSLARALEHCCRMADRQENGDAVARWKKRTNSLMEVIPDRKMLPPTTTFHLLSAWRMLEGE